MTHSTLTESRLLSFEVEGVLFALPISEILEVSESTPISSIPTLERWCGGVMNHRGDALPVFSLRVLVGSDVNFDTSLSRGSALAGKHLLVLSRSEDHSAELGLPVDSVRELVNTPAESEKCEGIVTERFFLEQREVAVIDSRQLMARAKTVVKGGSTAVHPATGG